MKWKIIKDPFTGIDNNQVLASNRFYVSYNADVGISPIAAMMDDMIEVFVNMGGIKTGKRSTEETALCSKSKCLVLNGDFRKQYEKVITKGYKACREVYTKNIRHKSMFSQEK